MAPRTKLRNSDINNAQIIDALIGSRTITNPTAVEVQKTEFDNLTAFMQHTANRLKYVQENGGGSISGSGFVLIQTEHEVFGGVNGQGGDYHFWYGSSAYMENPIGEYFYDIYDSNIDANSIVEVIPLDSDSEFINGFGACLRNESHSGFVRIFADMPPYNFESGRNFTVKLNIFKEVLKENEHIIEYNIIYYSPTGKKYGFMYWVDNSDENDIDQSGGISPLPSQFSTKPAGAAYNKYFLEYYDNGTIQVSGNVQSIEINGTLFETVNSYNATYNYTILAAPTNPFPESEIIGVTFDQALMVKIIFNE